MGPLHQFVFQFIPRWRFMNTYAQAGEDAIASYFFSSQGVQKPTYLDIGTNDPIYGNNSFLFYKRGSRGVCIEADPSLMPAINKARPHDVCLNAAVTFDDRTEADFFIFEERAHNTLSAEEAQERQKDSRSKLIDTIRIPLVNVNNVIHDHLGKAPDFLSIDVEGVDLAILRSIDLNKYRPKLICAETVAFSWDHTDKKDSEIADFLLSKDYVVYADTHINTLFADRHFLSAAHK